MSSAASKNAKQTRGRPFKPGNKFGKGRPVGSRNKATLALEALIEGQGEAVVLSMIEAAKQGNISAAKALLERLVPPKKSSPLAINIGEPTSPADFPRVAIGVFNNLARGEITPDEASQITAILSTQAKLHETLLLEERLMLIEERLGIDKASAS